MSKNISSSAFITIELSLISSFKVIIDFVNFATWYYDEIVCHDKSFGPINSGFLQSLLQMLSFYSLYQNASM